MIQQVLFEKDELVIQFSSLTAMAGLKSSLRIPYSAVKAVEAGHFALHWTALRIGGTSIPFGYKAGRFLYKGEKYFLAYRNASEVVILHLEGYDYHKVVIQAGTPKQLKNAIVKRCPQLA